MRIAVIGATGRTGRQVVEQALGRGHGVVALSRHPEAMTMRHDRLVTMTADVFDGDRLVEMLDGTDAVVSTLGIGASRESTVVYSDGIRNVASPMSANAITTLAVVSAAPVGPRSDQPLFQRLAVMPILERIFGSTYDDMRRMEALLRSTDLDWIALRPPHLIDKPATGHYRVDAHRVPPRSRNLTVADLASALLDSLGREDLYRRAAYVAN